MTAVGVEATLAGLRDPKKADFYPRFFRTGKGEYGEGDRFVGVVVTNQRKIARRFRALILSELAKLLHSPMHEHRLTALFTLVDQFQRADAAGRRRVAEFYLEHLDRVNNWDLVDASAHKILGPHLRERDRGLLDELAGSGHLWRQRIAIIATYAYIRAGDFGDTLRIADKLITHNHDLTHKAVGWMLREVGKRDLTILEEFLGPRYRRMPRRMLRYAIEKLEPARRKSYLTGKVCGSVDSVL